ncbi:MAG: tyrosine-type recombinase/integrase [Christensenellales bacterium]
MYATVKNILTKKHIVAQRCPIRDEKKEKKFLDDKQAKQLIEGLKNYRDIRIKTALMTLLFTGIRRGELSGLEWGDIDLEEQTISIRRSCCQVTGMGIVTGDTKTPKFKKNHSDTVSARTDIQRI